MYTRRSHERFVGPSRLGPPQNTCTFACITATSPHLTSPCTCNSTSFRFAPTHTPHTCIYICICICTCVCVFILCFCSCSVLVSTANRVKCCVLWPANVAVESVSVASPSSHRNCHWTTTAVAATELGCVGHGTGHGTGPGLGVGTFQRAAYKLINKVAKKFLWPKVESA